jgi:carboxylate-amine ligase
LEARGGDQKVTVLMPRPRTVGRGREVLGNGSEMAHATGGITLGVEEEFVLLDPSSGAAALAAPELMWMLDGEPRVRQELMRFQVETATGVCTDLDGVGRELAQLRRLVADAVMGLGCRLVATGSAPYSTPGLVALTDGPRYRELARRYGPLVADAGTCGCHVHVGVPSRDLGVQVLARLRPWLPSLLAISVNSPIAAGRDTGWASWRYPVWSRWPTATAPAAWPDAAAYDATVRQFIRRGAALDERSIYVLARLSPRYPTVEVRVADVCLDVESAVLLAGLTRALVATALAEARRGTPLAAVPTRWVNAALAAAARHGIAGPGVDAFTGETVAARDILTQLVDRVHAALEDRGDTGMVTALLHLLDDRGTGAERQRALFAQAGSAPEFVEALARATTAEAGAPPPAGPSAPPQAAPALARRRPAPAIGRDRAEQSWARLRAHPSGPPRRDVTH